MIDKRLEKVLKNSGYAHLKHTNDSGYIGVRSIDPTHVLVVGLTEYTYKKMFCYLSKNEAVNAFNDWDGSGDPLGEWGKSYEINDDKSVDEGFLRQPPPEPKIPELFTPYAVNMRWYYDFIIDKTKRLTHGSFRTKAEAQADARTTKIALERPEKFFTAWVKGLKWLSETTNKELQFFLNDDMPIDCANVYQDAEPNLAMFKLTIHRGGGAAVMAIHMYSFYNSARAVEFAKDDYEILTPWAAGARLDNKAKEILNDLSKNYCGW